MDLSTKQKQTQRHRERTCHCQGGRGGQGRGGLGIWGWQIQASKCRMGKQQGPPVQHRDATQCPEINWDRRECTRIAESRAAVLH